jgi:hypothetical protein
MTRYPCLNWNLAVSVESRRVAKNDHPSETLNVMITEANKLASGAVL